VTVTSRWEGAAYSSVGELQRSLALAEIDAYPWRGDESVLDVGCGDGAMTAQIAGRVPTGRVLGADVSPGQVEFASREHVAANLAFEVQDAARTTAPWPVDVVTSFNALHWVLDPAAALVSIAATMRPGGQLVVRVVGKGPHRPSLETVIAGVCASPAWAADFAAAPSPVEHLTPARWLELLDDAGFCDGRGSLEDRSWDFGSRAGFVDWLRGNSGSWTQRVDPSRVEHFLSDVVDAYEPLGGRPGLFRFVQLRLRAARCPGAVRSSAGGSR
jgi:trans-aconitate 2-methyltransferase